MDSRSVELISNLILEGSRRVVLIMGPGAVGKSYFALQIGEYLRSRGNTVAVIELDGFLLDRSVRMRDGWITAHNPEAFNIEQINVTLRNLIQNKIPQRFNILDKSVSKVIGTTLIEPSEFYIIEGTISFYLDVVRYSDIRIYITAAKAVQFQNRHKRESIEVGYSEDVSKRRFKSYWQDYQNFIRAKRKLADLKMIVDNKYIARITGRVPKLRFYSTRP